MSETKKESGAYGSKPNAPKEGNGWHCGRKTPKPEGVKTINPKANEGAAVKAAKRQNESETSDGTRILDVIPNSNGRSAQGREQ